MVTAWLQTVVTFLKCSLKFCTVVCSNNVQSTSSKTVVHLAIKKPGIFQSVTLVFPFSFRGDGGRIYF